MSKLIRIIVLLSALSYAASPARAQETVRAGGYVAGRVTDAGKAAAGFQVVLLSNGQTPVAKATTDGEGRYRIANVPPARYSVLPVAPAYVAETESGQRAAGVTVNVGAGEAVEGVDFSLTRGGVITGQVTDAEGQPLVAERVSLFLIEEAGRLRAPAVWNTAMFETDDRGIYRLFGLPAGRYKVSVGQGGAGIIRAGGRRVVYARTFYPDETDETRAGVVEVSAGGEAKGVDIRVGRPAQTFSASGHVVDAQTGRPLPGAAFSYASLGADPGQKAAVGRGLLSGARGEFHIDGLLPGRYVVFSNSEGLGDMYADPVAFTVTDDDVTSLEVKLRRGVSVSGVFAVEGSNSSRDILSRLSQVPVGAFLFQSELNSTGLLSSRIAPDGTFRVSGLRPGTLGIAPNSSRVPQGFVILRVEREGVEQHGFIDLSSGQDVTGLKVVLGYGSGSVRGQVRVAGGTLPAGTHLKAFIRRAGSYAATSGFTAQVDARGSFVFEGLAAGSYELMLGGEPTVTPEGLRPSPVPVVRRAVTVAEGATSDITLTLDLSTNSTSKTQ